MNATSRAIKGHANKLETELANARAELRELLADWRKALDERDEARAQIAAKDAAYARLESAAKDAAMSTTPMSYALFKLKLTELEAQIAAKDAALRECLAWFDEPFEGDVKSDMEMAVMVRAVLAQEPKP